MACNLAPVKSIKSVFYVKILKSSYQNKSQKQNFFSVKIGLCDCTWPKAPDSKFCKDVWQK